MNVATKIVYYYTIENNFLVVETVTKYDLSGSLDLRGTQITSLPENLSVGGKIYNAA